MLAMIMHQVHIISHKQTRDGQMDATYTYHFIVFGLLVIAAAEILKGRAK